MTEQLSTFTLDKQPGPTIKHRKLYHIQYPVINHNRKEYEKEGVCVYINVYV